VAAVEQRNYKGAGGWVGGIERDGGDGQADEKGVPEVETRHGGEFVGEAVISPDGPFAAWAVDCVYESITSTKFSSFVVRGICAQKPWRHARPRSENHKRKQVAERHCSSP